MTPKQVNDIFNQLPSKRRKVLVGFLAGHSREKIMIDADVPSYDALTGHLKELYKNFRIDTGWNDADDRRSGARKLPLLISLFARYMPELISDHIPEVLESVEQEGASPKPIQESAEVADIKENSSQASPSIEISSIREWRLKSINQLWSKDIGERISGIRKLERIAKDYPTEHWAIMEELAEFVRILAPRREEEERSRSIPGMLLKESLPSIPDDIRAALAIIGQCNSKKERSLDLSNTDLRGVNLSGANLNRVNFYRANLKGVNLDGVNLEGANLDGVNLQWAKLCNAKLQQAKLQRANLGHASLNCAELQGAILDYASLEMAYLCYVNLQEAKLCNTKLKGAILRGADLQGATLDGAELKGAFLNGTNLEGAFLDVADLKGANLFEVKNLKSLQLETAFGNSQTLLPDDVEAPVRWQQSGE